MKKLILSCLSLFLVFPVQAYGQTQKDDTQTYLSGNIGAYGFSGTGNGETITSEGHGGFHIRGGTKFSKYFGVEGEAGIGLGGIPTTTNRDLTLDYQFAAYGIARIPIGKNNRDRADLFMRLGYHVSEFSLTGGPQSESLSQDGFAFGLGGNYFFKDSLGVRVEISSFNLSDDFFSNVNEITYLGGSIGLVKRF